MKTILLIKSDTATTQAAEEDMLLQLDHAITRVVVFDLREPEPDYVALLDQIFRADSIQVW